MKLEQKRDRSEPLRVRGGRRIQAGGTTGAKACVRRVLGKRHKRRGGWRGRAVNAGKGREGGPEGPAGSSDFTLNETGALEVLRRRKRSVLHAVCALGKTKL